MASNEQRPRGGTAPGTEIPGVAHSRLDLALSPSAVRWGRAHVEDVLAKWGVAEAVVGDAVVIASELLSNAVEHAAPMPSTANGRPGVAQCGLLLWLTDRGLTVAVYDGDRRPPVLRVVPPADAERGRGLLLVQTLSETWGYNYPTPRSGKLVYARLAVPRAQGQQHSAAPPVMSA
jgi:anti-sigma regulatory factor (Ser/Thr protein kinase)